MSQIDLFYLFFMCHQKDLSSLRKKNLKITFKYRTKKIKLNKLKKEIDIVRK